MEINLAVHYIGYDTRIVQRGSFPVHWRRFKENEQQEVLRVAKGFITDIKRTNRIFSIEKVIYNNEQDITELVTKYM